MDNSIEHETDYAILSGMRNADITWQSYAIECMRVIASRYQTFTMDDVRPLVQTSPVKTHDNRAMGGVVKWAMLAGWIERTGQSIPSRTGHKTPIQVWNSRLYKGAEQREIVIS